MYSQLSIENIKLKNNPKLGTKFEEEGIFDGLITKSNIEFRLVGLPLKTSKWGSLL